MGYTSQYVWFWGSVYAGRKLSVYLWFLKHLSNRDLLIWDLILHWCDIYKCLFDFIQFCDQWNQLSSGVVMLKLHSSANCIFQQDLNKSAPPVKSPTIAPVLYRLLVTVKVYPLLWHYIYQSSSCQCRAAEAVKESMQAGWLAAAQLGGRNSLQTLVCWSLHDVLAGLLLTWI